MPVPAARSATGVPSKLVAVDRRVSALDPASASPSNVDSSSGAPGGGSKAKPRGVDRGTNAQGLFERGEEDGERPGSSGSAGSCGSGVDS
eukprot:427104-Prorocentrum_minimum.AAC.1